MAECTCELILTVEEPDEIELSYVEAEIKPEQTKNVVPAEEAQTVEPDPGFTLGAVNVEAIPSEYIIPTGTKEIAQNGDVDVTEFATARVAVPLPSGKVTLTANGTHDVYDYAEAEVAVPPPTLQQKTVTPTKQQQTIEADSGYDALSRVTVERIPQEYIVPTGTKQIDSDGAYDVKNYESAVVSTAPSKGVVFRDWDADGYPATIDIIGFDAVPGYYCYGISSQGYANTFYRKIKTYNVFADAIGQNGCASINYLNSKVEEINVYGTNIRVGIAAFGLHGECKKVSFYGNVTSLSSQSFTLNSKTELYDFSRCTTIPTMQDSALLGHKDGCVIKIPYALSDEALGTGNGWQSATNWAALPTDPNTSGYVVWEVVNNAQS